MRKNHSDEFRDFITKLLIKDMSKRLGCEGHQEVLDHSWFKEHIYDGETVPSFDFRALEER